MADDGSPVENAADGGEPPERRRRNSSSFKRGVHGLDDVVGGSIARPEVQFRGQIEMVSGTERGQPRRRQRYVLIGPDTVEYFASEEAMVSLELGAFRSLSLSERRRQTKSSLLADQPPSRARAPSLRTPPLQHAPVRER